MSSSNCSCELPTQHDKTNIVSHGYQDVLGPGCKMLRPVLMCAFYAKNSDQHWLESCTTPDRFLKAS